MDYENDRNKWSDFELELKILLILYFLLSILSVVWFIQMQLK